MPTPYPMEGQFAHLSSRGQVNEWKWTLLDDGDVMCLVTLSLNFKQRDAKSHPIQ